MRPYFVYHQTVDVERHDGDAASRIASAIGEPARARMLYCLMDNHARTGTELAVIADISPSTASVHLSRLQTEGLVKVHVQGRHRYYCLDGPDVAAVLEGLSVLAGNPRTLFEPNTPQRLRSARTCYDHLAGTLGVQLHDLLHSNSWLTRDYKLTTKGTSQLEKLGVPVDALTSARRRFAYACLDWSEPDRISEDLWERPSSNLRSRRNG